ncbi:MAG: SMP-30/gluconolactonase/LRE family protein [Candidatus Competibacteraceae bacterium]|nr:SMP-30/gluconolactonase/LRE family protein [Candidatus Competibacteraceae bacterium]
MRTTTKIISIFIGMAAYAVSSSGLAQALEKNWESAAELKGPESALYDSGRDVIYVSNVNGDANAVDGNGFISKVALDGSIVELEWVTGLNAPKGLAMAGDMLYVSDINTLVEIALDSGEISNRYEAADAKFLNDVAVDAAGNVYVSDMVANAIYRLQDGNFGLWIQDDQLENPNGLFVDGEQMIIGSWGKMTDGFSTEVPGHLKSVSLADGSIQSLGDGTPAGNLDGVESDGNGNYYVTDWMNGKLLLIDTSGNVTELLVLGQGSADLGVIPDQGLLLIPMMMNNTLHAYTVK